MVADIGAWLPKIACHHSSYDVIVVETSGGVNEADKVNYLTANLAILQVLPTSSCLINKKANLLCKHL